MIIIERGPHKLPKVIMEISDYPYAKDLSPEAYEHLKATCDEKVQKYLRQKRYIARLMAKKAKFEKEEAEKNQAA